jgi:hypothetical protein
MFMLLKKLTKLYLLSGVMESQIAKLFQVLIPLEETLALEPQNTQRLSTSASEGKKKKT